MKLILIRHSKSFINPSIPIHLWGLSEEGVELAKKLQQNTFIKELNVIYSSLQTKALETAVLTTKNLGIPIRTDNRLTEITSFTRFFESDKQKYTQSIKDFYTGKVDRLYDGESSKEALKRFNNAVNDIVINENDKEKIGIVSHGNILAHFCTQFIEKDKHYLAEKIKQPDIAILDWITKKFDIFFGDI